MNAPVSVTATLGHDPDYNFGYLDEQTKRMIRRALLKAGFVEEGRRISHWLVAGCRQDGILLGRVNPSIAADHRSQITKDI